MVLLGAASIHPNGSGESGLTPQLLLHEINHGDRSPQLLLLHLSQTRPLLLRALHMPGGVAGSGGRQPVWEEEAAALTQTHVWSPSGPRSCPQEEASRCPARGREQGSCGGCASLQSCDVQPGRGTAGSCLPWRGAGSRGHVQQPLPERQREAFPRTRTAAASRFHLLGNSLQQMQCNYHH